MTARRRLGVSPEMRASIIGFGHIAHGQTPQGPLPLSHLDAYRALRRRVSLVSIVDPDRKNQVLARKLIAGVNVYEDVGEMFRRERPDIVSICSPDGLHTQHLAEIANYGARAIWCEKPVAADMAQVMRLESMAGDLPPVQVNYWRRFVPEVRKLRDRIHANDYGRVNCLAGYYPEGWLRNGSHLIDLLGFMGGEVAVTHHACVRFGGENHVIASGTAAGKASWMAMPVPRDRYNIFELDILCQRARLRVTENGRAIEAFRDRKDPEFRHLRILRTTPSRMACNWKHAFRVALANLIDCAEGKVADTMSPLRNALAVARTMTEILSDAQSHEAVRNPS